jgi:hypothetical protein
VADEPQKKKTRRGSRGGVRRSRAKKAAAEGAPISEQGKSLPVAESTPPPAPAVVRTGSTDRHLISDEPVSPEPVYRPRTYRDLDHIPDDLD